MAHFILLLSFAYLLGSVPFGKLVGKYHCIDIQTKGSGNIGFANARRVLGWRAGLLVLAADMAKGFIPVFIAHKYCSFDQTSVVAATVMLGSIFPVWLKFRGGKGIATALGAVLAMTPAIGLIAILIYLAGVGCFRKSAPSSLLAVWSLPLLCLILTPAYFWLYLFFAVVAALTHRKNIRQLLRDLNRGH